MIVENPESYRFVRFEKSYNRTKKYDAILRHKQTGREKRISFGAMGYEHFHDKALGIYKSLNHNDPKRRALYRQRHQGEDKRKFSSGYFAWKYLW